MSDETRDQIIASMMSYTDATDFATEKSWLHELIDDFEDHFDTRYQRKAEEPEPVKEEPKCPVCGVKLAFRGDYLETSLSKGTPNHFRGRDKVVWFCMGNSGCPVMYWSQDSRGIYIRHRYSAPDKSLVIDFWLREKLLAMQVVEQDERWRRLWGCPTIELSRDAETDLQIKSIGAPMLSSIVLYVRGSGPDCDNDKARKEYPTTRAALDAMLAWGKLIKQVKLPEPMPRPEPMVGMKVHVPGAPRGYSVVGKMPSGEWMAQHETSETLYKLPSDWQPVGDKP